MNEEAPMMDLAALVRTRDYDSHLAIQLAPRARRPALYAVTAFATELAHIDARMSDVMMAAIRFAWWREALEEIAAGAAPRRHPIVLALADVYREAPAAFTHLFSMLELYADDEKLAHSLLAVKLHEAWIAILGETIDEASKSRLSAENELIWWTNVIARTGFSEDGSTVRFHRFLNMDPENLNQSLAFLNSKIGSDPWKTAGLAVFGARLESTRKPWPPALKLLGVPAVIARFRFRQMMHRSDSATLSAISETSPRKIFDVLYYALVG